MEWVVLTYKTNLNHELGHAFFGVKRLREIMKRYEILPRDVVHIYINEEPKDIKEVLTWTM